MSVRPPKPVPAETTEVFVLIHVKHTYDKALGHPVDSQRWLSVHESFGDATVAGVKYAEAKGLVSEIPVHVWWRMAPEGQARREWWMSNEFGPAKDVGNSFRVTMRVAKMGAQK